MSMSSMTAVATATGSTFIPDRLLRKGAEALPDGVRIVEVSHPTMANRIKAQVADLGDPFGQVARWGAGVDVDGRKRHAYYQFDPARGTAERSFGAVTGAPVDEATIFEGLRTSFGSRFLSESIDAIDPMRGELQAFEDQFPLIASRLIDSKVLPGPLRKAPVPAGFGPGFWAHQSPFRCAGAPVVGAMERFAAGDMGDFGTIPGEPLSELERWAARIMPRRVRNRAAHEDGFGLIVGRYGVPGHRKAGPGHVWIMERLRGPDHKPAFLVGWWPAGSAVFPSIAGITDPADLADAAPDAG